MVLDRLTPIQVRGARGMLGWSMLDLAKAASVSVSTAKRFESGEAGVSPAAVGMLQSALETAGVEFLPDAGKGPGLRLRPNGVSPLARFC